MKKSEWESHFKGFYIVDCAIRHEHFAYVLLVQNNPPEGGDREEWRLISWVPKILESSGLTTSLTDFFNLRSIPRLAVQFLPEERLLLCDTGLFGWAGGPDNGVQPQPGLMKQMRTLWDEVYFINGNALYVRNGTSNVWEEIAIHPAIAEDYNDTTTDRRYLLNDFDAFSKDEFYLLDYEGTVFYQSDGEWNVADLKNLGYPNLQTPGICCGPDGWVYVFGKDENGGKIFQGKGDRWKVIWESPSGIFHIDMVAYQDSVLISNDLMLSKIKDGKVSDFDAPIYGKFLSVRDNLLMLASRDQAAIYDGHEWKVIISPNFNEEGVFLIG